MPATRITTVDDLKEYLYVAMQLEHATIPPYLTALYSIHPGTNTDVYNILRVVVVEEMLHLTIAANLLNAIGGTPTLTRPGKDGSPFVPVYPAYLPNGERDFKVDLRHFSPDALKDFLDIERPGLPDDDDEAKLPRVIEVKAYTQSRLGGCPGREGYYYYSIGDFYEEIRRGFEVLHAQYGDALFCGDPARQVSSEYYYSGGAELHVVTDLESVRKGIDLIIEQGEGRGGQIYGNIYGGIYNAEREIAHYYRFKQIELLRYYRRGDKNPDEPSGPPLLVDWDAVYKLKENAKLSDYEDDPELLAAATAFNTSYWKFLKLVEAAYNGSPGLLLEAVPAMFRIRNEINQLVRYPLGSSGENAAPTFEVP